MFLMMRSSTFGLVQLHFVVLLIGSHEVIPEPEFRAKVTGIMRVMEIMILPTQFPRDER